MNYVHNYDACVYRASTNIRNMGLHLPVGLESLLNSIARYVWNVGSGSNGRACEIILPLYYTNTLSLPLPLPLLRPFFKINLVIS